MNICDGAGCWESFDLSNSAGGEGWRWMGEKQCQEIIVDGGRLGKGLSERSLGGWAVCDRLLSELGLSGISRVLWSFTSG